MLLALCVLRLRSALKHCLRFTHQSRINDVRSNVVCRSCYLRAADISPESTPCEVTKGQYPRIPSHFSQDLSEVIGLLLQVQPRQRPSVEQLLQEAAGAAATRHRSPRKPSRQ
ncbi:unnamed protein product [Prorocentrum cordatum]|uniref:Uncharacterized protein n=1 Tax=Prorocentrum cordatum TaxID=2364126 RepID=A0ABN9R861_9DINO|nr:unnamed protein product [Polarella glacialis]